MLFSTLLFLFVFLPGALAIYFLGALLSGNRAGVCNAVIICLSLAFYFWGSGALVALLAASVLVNWLLGRLLAQAASWRRTLLALGIAFNAGNLLYFKYCRFLLDSLGLLLDAQIAPDLHPFLPVGISFYTFMSISYLVDVYRRTDRPASLLEYGTYLTLFPHLVAGPIVRFGEIAHELRRRGPGLEDFTLGILRFAQGLGMKVLLADNLARTVDAIFALGPGELTSGVAWLGALGYTFQIYFDFAGYSAMAIGLARMLGFIFPENFNLPYRSRSMTEFWRRWHMSLSRWLRDYLYIPLGGNRKGPLRTYVNLFLVFFICGLWHGAAWTFVAWGVYHGLLLIVERLWRNRFAWSPPAAVGIPGTFLLACVGWVLFRSGSFGQCAYYLQAMFGFAGGFNVYTNLPGQLGGYMDPLPLYALAASALFSFLPFDRLAAGARTLAPRCCEMGGYAAATVVLAISAAYIVGHSYTPFIYFRF